MYTMLYPTLFFLIEMYSYFRAFDNNQLLNDVYIMNENWENEYMKLFLMSNKLVASEQTKVTLSILICQIASRKFFSHFQWYPDVVCSWINKSIYVGLRLMYVYPRMYLRIWWTCNLLSMSSIFKHKVACDYPVVIHGQNR